MLFNSIEFAIFLIVIFVLYWLSTNNIKRQNLILLIASYFFYACWDWRFLFLLVFSTVLDFFTGIKMHQSKNEKEKKIWFWVSISINLGFLGVFKYFNFFTESFVEVLSALSVQANPWTIQLILPVGISFYTFHGLSYVIDIYKNRISPERNFRDYSLFVSFFPLLVAGPIERATHLLPQIKHQRTFNYANAVDGLKQILWGLFKKVVIADNCATYANYIFDGHSDLSGSTLLLGAVFFAFQIYGDFSGYSDIALGTARLFGIELLRNFNYPYFSRDIAEFWRRWHISLSTWFRDYLYIPLGGSKGGSLKRVSNTFIIFIVSGFWHGANWTFIVWGMLNALYIMPSIVLKTNRVNLNIVADGRMLPTFKEFVQMIFTFLLTCLAWIFFRSENLQQAFDMISTIFSSSLFSWPLFPKMNFGYITLVFVLIFLSIEWIGRKEKYPIEKISLILPRPARWAVYYVIILAIFLFAGSSEQFIYFQF